MECNLSNFRKEAWKTFVRALTGFEPMPPQILVGLLNQLSYKATRLEPGKFYFI